MSSSNVRFQSSCFPSCSHSLLSEFASPTTPVFAVLCCARAQTCYRPAIRILPPYRYSTLESICCGRFPNASFAGTLRRERVACVIITFATQCKHVPSVFACVSWAVFRGAKTRRQTKRMTLNEDLDACV